MVNRYGDPQEVAYLVKFLVSKEADFINNTVIRIDGGQKEVANSTSFSYLIMLIK